MQPLLCPRTLEPSHPEDAMALLPLGPPRPWPAGERQGQGNIFKRGGGMLLEERPCAARLLAHLDLALAPAPLPSPWPSTSWSSRPSLLPAPKVPGPVLFPDSSKQTPPPVDQPPDRAKGRAHRWTFPAQAYDSLPTVSWPPPPGGTPKTASPCPTP